jgi:hypothetical protein
MSDSTSRWRTAPAIPVSGVVLAGVLGLTSGACASAPASPLSESRESTTRVTMQTSEGGAATDHTLRREEFIAISQLPASRQAVWQHLRAVWDDVGLTEPVADQRAFSLSLIDLTITRRLGRTPLSAYLSCGSSMTGWNADTHRIRLTVRTVLERVTADTTRVHTRVDAVAHNTSGTSTAPTQCTSRGTLEDLIARRVRERLAAT